MGVVIEICIKPGGSTQIRVANVRVDILYPLQYTPPACNPLCPMRLVCARAVLSLYTVL